MYQNNLESKYIIFKYYPLSMFEWKSKINICKYLKNRNTDEKLMVQLIMC